MNLWRITYLNKLTGKRQNYMQVGFESEQQAFDEVRRLKDHAKKIAISNTDLLTFPQQFIKAWMVAVDIKVEPIKLKNEHSN